MIEQLAILKKEIQKYKNLAEKQVSSEMIIIDIMTLFKIPIDESRISDYRITKIDFNKLSLQVIDNKTDTTFTSNYSKDSEVLGLIAYEEIVKFINVYSKNSSYERGTVYYIGEDTPILEKMTIHNNEYSLFFRKTMPNVINNFNRQDGTQFKVTYSKEDDKKEVALSSYIYKTGYTYKNINSFERSFIHNCHLTYGKNIPDRFLFDIDGNIIVGTKFNNETYLIEGACFEMIDDNCLTETLMNPFNNKVKDYSLFDTSLVKSTVLYAGYSFLGKTRYYHDIEISKKEDGISIIYSIKDKSRYPNQTIILETNYVISNLCKGNISMLEVNNIILELESKFSKDNFVQFVINELLTFKEKLAIKNGLISEVLNPLSPKLLINNTFEEIFEVVNSNKEIYFRLASELLESMTDDYGIAEKQQQKIFKPRK